MNQGVFVFLLPIILTSTLTSGEEQRGRSHRIRQKETTHNEKEGTEMQDNMDIRLMEIIMVKEKVKNMSTKRSRKPGTSQRRDNSVYKRTLEDSTILGWK